VHCCAPGLLRKLTPGARRNSGKVPGDKSSTRLTDCCGDLRVRRDAADSVASSLSSRLNSLWLRARLVAERKNQLANDPQLSGGRAHLLAQLANGFITGVRFSKGVNNTGTHMGNLWSSSGTLLARATFTGEKRLGLATGELLAPRSDYGQHRLCCIVL